jgi:hypothetical protein
VHIQKCVTSKARALASEWGVGGQFSAAARLQLKAQKSVQPRLKAPRAQKKGEHSLTQAKQLLKPAPVEKTAHMHR